MTFTEFTSWTGPQSVHAFSPKCRSANTAILNAAPARIWTYLSPPEAFVVGGGSKASTWSSNPTVKMKREKQVKDKIAIWVWVCGLFNSIERREEKRIWVQIYWFFFFFFWVPGRWYFGWVWWWWEWVLVGNRMKWRNCTWFDWDGFGFLWCPCFLAYFLLGPHGFCHLQFVLKEHNSSILVQSCPGRRNIIWSHVKNLCRTFNV